MGKPGRGGAPSSVNPGDSATRQEVLLQGPPTRTRDPAAHPAHPPRTRGTPPSHRPPSATPTSSGQPSKTGPRPPSRLVPPTRGLDQAHRQSPLGPDHPRQRPPRDHRRPRTLASPQTHQGPSRLDPSHRVGPGPDARHRHQRHASRDRTPTTGPSGDGPPSGPEPPGAVGTGHRTKPRHRPPRRRPPHPRRPPPPPHLQTVTTPRRRSGLQSSSAATTTW